MTSSARTTVTRLRRGLPVQLVLVHGLFSNAAFWLPHLERFQAFQLTLLGIDHDAILNREVELETIAREAEALIAPGPAHLVCHSFGSVPGLELRRSWLSRTFIGPTFAATSVDSAAFCASVAQRTGTDVHSAALLVERAVAHKTRALLNARWTERDLICVPDDDPYFAYVTPPGVDRLHYAGGHFDVGAPMATLAARLARN